MPHVEFTSLTARRRTIKSSKPAGFRGRHLVGCDGRRGCWRRAKTNTLVENRVATLSAWEPRGRLLGVPLPAEESRIDSVDPSTRSTVHHLREVVGVMIIIISAEETITGCVENIDPLSPAAATPTGHVKGDTQPY